MVNEEQKRRGAIKAKNRKSTETERRTEVEKGQVRRGGREVHFSFQLLGQQIA